jgi:uncharacterized protein (TIGR02145 family)
MKNKLNNILFGFVLCGLITLDSCGDKVPEPFVKETYTYKTVVIGTQEWMAEDLRENTFCDGERIEEVKDSATWASLTRPSFAYYKNDKAKYGNEGKIYNWYTLKDNRNICPCGWHVPDYSEWQTLIDFLDGMNKAGAAIKATGTLKEGTGLWEYPNYATNASGFSAVPNYFREGTGKFSLRLAYGSSWWSSPTFGTWVETIGVGNMTEGIGRYSASMSSIVTDRKSGASIRCLNDREVVVTEPFVKETYTYKTVKIGTQEWMAEDLKNNTYCNGEPIEEVKKSSEWDNLKRPGFVYVENDKVKYGTAGKLYNWHAATDTRNICPCGWHVPSSKEWEALGNYLGGPAVAGLALKATGTLQSNTGLWNEPNSATNGSGFSAIPNAVRSVNGFTFNSVVANWWASTPVDVDFAKSVYVQNTKEDFFINDAGLNKPVGIAVRCVKD